MYAEEGGGVVGVVYKNAEFGEDWLTKIMWWREEYVLCIYVINNKVLPPFDASVCTIKNIKNVWITSCRG
jgi:hypothetical protein